MSVAGPPALSERWLPVAEEIFEDFYSISNRGRVLAHTRLIVRVHTGPYWRPEQLIAPRRGNDQGHLAVTLYDGDGRRHKRWIHRLVAEAHIPNPHGFPFVLHGVRGPGINDVTNLRWGNQSENEKDKLRHKIARQTMRESQ